LQFLGLLCRDIHICTKQYLNNSGNRTWDVRFFLPNPASICNIPHHQSIGVANMKSEAFYKACMSATVAVAWAGSSSPAMAVTPGDTQTVYIRTNFWHSLTAARFVGANSLTWVMVDLGAIEAGTQYRTIGVSLGTGLGSGYNGMDWYTIIGTGLGSGAPGVGSGGFLAGFSDNSGALGQPFETVFPGVDEALLNEAITTGSPLLEGFVSSLMSRPANQLSFGTTSSALSFSNGTDAGTILADFSPVPEPGSAIVCLGALGIGMLCRRRSV
jgi:hypothetical protein